MKCRQMFSKLPALASDLSGYCSVFFGMNCMIVLYGPGGCAGNFSFCDEIRWIDGEKDFFITALTDIEAITGDESFAVKKIKNSFQNMDYPFIAMVGAPITTMIGCDLNAIGDELEKTLKCPVCVCTGHGFRRFDEGQEEAYLNILEKFVDKDIINNSKNGVNIIGATSHNGFNQKMVDEISSFYEKDYGDTCVWAMGADIDSIKNAGKAKKNIALSTSAIATVKKMKEIFGTEYMVEIPIGMNTIYSVDGEYGKSKVRILLVMDQIWGNSIRKFLKKYFLNAEIDVVSFFSMYNEYMEKNDCHVEYEKDFEEFLHANKKYGIVIGDGTIKKFFDKEQHFLKMPYPAICGKNNVHDYVIEKYEAHYMNITSEYNMPELLDVISIEGAQKLLEYVCANL